MNIETLPNDIDQLKEIIKNHLASLQEKDQIIHSKESEIEILKEKLALSKLFSFGRKSEAWTEDDALQARLFDEAESTSNESNIENQEPNDIRIQISGHTRKKRGRKPINPKLERTTVTHDLSDEEKICSCGAHKQKIGEDQSEELKVIPARVEVIRHVYPKYTCKNCHGLQEEGKPEVQSAPRPKKLLPKTYTTASLLAYLFAGKFVYGLPYNREQKFFKSLGIDISREVMSQWQIKAYEKIKVIYDLFHNELLLSKLLGIDETPLQVHLEPGKKNTSKSYMWVFRGGTKEHPLILFDYHPTRSAQVVLDFLDTYQGSIITDGYGGYNQLRQKKEIIAAGCWDHVRRNFIKAYKISGEKSRANEMLKMIKDLYAIEKLLKEEPPDKILEARKEHSTVVIDRIKNWLDDIHPKTNPESQLGKAIQYAINEWPYLITFLTNPLIPLSNILVENAIRPFAIGRKNWLFSGSPRGAAASAMLYSLVESAKANGLDAYWYLYYLFEHFPLAQSNEEILNLMPHRIDPAKIKQFMNQVG